MSNIRYNEIPLKAALYVRLSKEDRNKVNKEDDSESIVNQQNMLIDYCRQKEWIVYDIYNDEDFSGSDRDRPDFNRMINDARENKFDVIICKTQSRFARDMEMIEKYINRLFPVWGIRFLSIVDNNDSSNKANRKSRQINSLVDQWYLEDLSDNIRATLSSKRRQGLWVGAFAPYGYIKDPNNKNHLVIDKEAAEIVQYVFDLYLQGYGVTTIARRLNAEHIPNPATYKQQHGQPFQNVNKKCSDIWHTYSVQRMISNEVYIGNTVQGVQENVSYKSNKKRNKPRKEWDIVEGTHEAIISRDVWDRVQRLRASKPKSGRTGKPNIFATKVRCLRCGSAMRIYYTHHERYFRCNTAYFADNRCTGTFVSEKVLQREVLKQIKILYNTYVDDNYVLSEINPSNGLQQKKEKLQRLAFTINQKIENLDARIKDAYIDKLDGVISVEDFLSLKREFNTEKQSLENDVKKLNSQIDDIDYQLSNSKSQYELLQQFKDIEELDYTTVNTLIDYIEVGGNKNNRIINIHWNF